MTTVKAHPLLWLLSVGIMNLVGSATSWAIAMRTRFRQLMTGSILHFQ